MKTSEDASRLPGCGKVTNAGHPHEEAYRQRLARWLTICFVSFGFGLVADAQTVYQGLTNSPLGNATLMVNTNYSLVISNLGSSGQDGVTIGVGATPENLAVNLQDLDASNMLPTGAYVESQLVGTANGVTNGALGTLMATKSSSKGATTIFADFSPMGASTYTVQLYDQGVLIDQASKKGTDSLEFSANSFQALSGMGMDSMVANCCISNLTSGGQDGLTMVFAGGTSILVSGQAVSCDRICFIPENVAWPSEVTAFQLVASQVPVLAVTSENITAPYAGYDVTSLGNAALTVSGNSLFVSNLTSGGQDGVTMAMPTNPAELVVNWQNLDPSNTLPVGAYVQSQVVGTANGITNGVLGTLTATKSSSSTGGVETAIFPDFSAMGADTYTVQAYDRQVLAAQATNQTAGYLEISSDIQTISGAGLDSMVPNCCISNLTSSGQDGLTMVFAGGTSVMIAGQAVTCDQLCFVPENVSWPSSVTAFQIVAPEIPALTIDAVAVSPLLMNLSQTGQGLSLQWYGTANLQESADLASWTNDANATSPYAVVVNNAGSGGSSPPVKFYRLVFRP